MSTTEISKTLKDLYELRAMRAELDDEITALEDKVKAEMAERGVNELEGAGHIAKYAEYTSILSIGEALIWALPVREKFLSAQTRRLC